MEEFKNNSFCDQDNYDEGGRGRHRCSEGEGIN